MNLSIDRVPPKGQIDPASVAAAGAAASGWIDAATALRFAGFCAVGAGAGSAAFTWRQADTSGGGNAKAVSGPATLTLTTGQNGATEVRPEQLDLAAGFRWVQLSCTVTGGAGTLVGAVVAALEPEVI